MKKKKIQVYHQEFGLEKLQQSGKYQQENWDKFDETWFDRMKCEMCDR